MNFPNWSTSRTQNPKQTTGYPISTCLDWRTWVQTTFARHNVCHESLSHPTILTFVALPHHISFRSHPLDILWYPDWVLQLNPLLLEKDFWTLLGMEVYWKPHRN